VQSIIIEGGASTLSSFIEAGLWDEARIFTGAAQLRQGIKAPGIIGRVASDDVVGDDKLITLVNG